MKRSTRPPDHPLRRVVLIVGPPGSGKTTLAHTLGLDVYDLDDEHWGRADDWRAAEDQFRQALTAIGHDPNAEAVVIRTATNPLGARITQTQCRATELVTLDVDPATCIQRITQRDGDTTPDQLEAIHDWHRQRH